MSLAARVAGLGLWTPSAPSVAAWLEGQVAAAPSADPPAALLGPRLRRRTSLLTRMACEALGQALAAAGADPARTVTVFASAWGELATTLALLDQLAGEGALSPALFHNSVQNTAAGHASIAAACRAPSTTLAAGPSTVAMGLLEALARLAAPGGDVALVAADEPVPPPFAQGEPAAPLAVALLLRAGGPGPALSLARGEPTLSPGRTLPPALARSPAAPALALLDALVRGTPGRVALEPGDGARACAEVSA